LKSRVEQVVRDLEALRASISASSAASSLRWSGERLRQNDVPAHRRGLEPASAGDVKLDGRVVRGRHRPRLRVPERQPAAVAHGFRQRPDRA